MKKKIISMVLLLAIMFTLLPSIELQVSAMSINDASVFIKQGTNKTCTLAATTMMYKRRALKDGQPFWSSITELSLKDSAWGENGLKGTITYKGTTSKAVSFGSTDSEVQKKNTLIKLLNSKPEGVVIYETKLEYNNKYGVYKTTPHAILLTDYDSSTDTFYCADPDVGAKIGRIKLIESTLNPAIKGGDVHNNPKTQISIINGLDKYWHITNIAWTDNAPILFCDPPTIDKTDFFGGIKLVFSKYDTNEKIWYSINGGASFDNTTENSITKELYAPYKYDVVAYVTRDNYQQSSKISRTIEVETVLKPEISTKYTADGMQVAINCRTSGAQIYYTTIGSGTPPIHESNKYKGPTTITSNMKIRAIAVASGYANSDVAELVVNPTKPSIPTAELFNTNSKIAIGEIANVLWSTSPTASNYTATLYKNGQKVTDVTTEGTVASFKLENEGQYEIKVKANNYFGSSNESYPAVIVNAMNPVKVKFIDYNGDIIEEQQVKYGYDATTPKIPSRKGHTFSGWDKPYTSCIENIEVKATYQINIYTIRFYDVNGITLLNSQRIEFEGTATPPTTYTLPTGYVFAGWNVDPNSLGTDYNCVDGDMKLTATKCWFNKDLPVVLEILSAFRDDNGKTYTVRAKLTNTPRDNTRGKVVATLKTSENKAVKSVYQTFDADQDNPSNPYAQYTKEIEIKIPYTDKATTVELVAVGLETDDKTGGAYSKIVSSGISARTAWSEYTPWSSTQLTGYDDFETTKQYSFRNKTTTTGTTPTMQGWTWYDTTSAWGNWSDWLSYNPGATSTRLVEPQTVFAGYQKKQQWLYSRFYGWYTNPSTGKSYWVANPTIGTTSKTYEDTGWWDSPLENQGLHSTGTTYIYGRNARPNSAGVNRDCWWYNEQTIWVDNPNAPIYNTQWRYRDLNYTYYFYKWNDWSAWVDAPVAGNETREQTLYRYRNLVNLSDPNSGTEDTSGETYSINGSLTGATEDLYGKIATILVYKRANTDPTQEQLEYVGQTTLGVGNSYSYTFKTREIPSADTGDFVVTMALEGAKKLIEIDTIKAPQPEYIVKFIADGAELSTQTVLKGENAIIPEIPTKLGYTFVGWSERTTNIIEELTIAAKFIKNEYVAVFADFENEKIDLNRVKYGEKIIPPVLSDVEGKTFDGWYSLINGVETKIENEYLIADDTILIAKWIPKTFIVTFIDNNGSPIEGATQMVAYGEAAQLPDDLIIENKIFAGWSTDFEWWNVKKDMTIHPIVLNNSKTEAPMYGQYADIDFNGVVLQSSTKDAVIYYTLDGTIPNETSEIYNFDEGIVVYDDTTIKAFAIVDNKEPSEVVTMNIGYKVYEVPPIDPEVPQTGKVDKEASAGKQIDVEFTLSNNPGISALKLTAGFDSNVLTLVSATNGGVFADSSFTPGPIENVPFLMNWATTSDNTNNGALVILRFAVSQDAVIGKYPVALNIEASNINEQDVVFETAIASISVVEYVKGDINNDNEVDMKDATRLLKYLVGWNVEANQKALDVNGDIRVDMKDATRLLKYLAGWNVELN